jgi:hypothetical protein
VCSYFGRTGERISDGGRSVSLDKYLGGEEVGKGYCKRFGKTEIERNIANVEKSYICGATNVFAWIAICSGIAIIAPQLILGLAVFWIPGYVREPWHAFLVYQAVNLVVLVFNIYLVKRANWIHDAACKSLILSLGHILRHPKCEALMVYVNSLLFPLYLCHHSRRLPRPFVFELPTFLRCLDHFS